MLVKGFEPSISYEPWILSPIRIPIPTHQRNWASWIRTNEYMSQSHVPFPLGDSPLFCGSYFILSRTYLIHRNGGYIPLGCQTQPTA